MKKPFLILFTTVSILFFAQKYTVSAGASFPFLATKQNLDGAGTNEVKPGFNVGISTAFMMDNADEIELGVYYQQNKIVSTSAPIPPSASTKTEKKFNLFFVPINYKYNFENQIFIKGGPIFTLDSYKKDGYFDNYSGIGFGVSAGKDFGTEGLKFRVAPYANAHTLLSFKDNNHFMNDFGLQIGLVF